jgi:hypothetical protein
MVSSYAQVLKVDTVKVNDNRVLCQPLRHFSLILTVFSPVGLPKHVEAFFQIQSGRDRAEVVQHLDGTGALSLKTKPGQKAVHHRDPAAQRDGRAAHGAHAEQHHPGRAGAPCADAGEERLLGAGYGPREHRHGGEGGAPAGRTRHQEERHRPRGVPEACLRVEGESTAA